MTKEIFNFPKAFTAKKKKNHITLVPVTDKGYDTWLKKQDATTQALAKQNGFSPNGKHILVTPGSETIYVGIQKPLGLYDFSKIQAAIAGAFSKDFLDSTTFEIDPKGMKEPDLRIACIGWSLASYEFTAYKEPKKAVPQLLWPDINKTGVTGRADGIHLLRNMVNMPANDMGPDDIEKTARKIAKDFEAKIKVIKGEALLKENFPLVHMVGRAHPREPRLIDITWAKSKAKNNKHPKITIVGKGVSFDTGGLNIKPTQYMKLMKKDMAGAAHALAAAYIIMSLNLPVQLRVIVPAVENSIAGDAFRPGDVSSSRKGLTVENTNTDAEGRLILADALTYACEDKPDLLIDFATLTGSARAALGQDIPAMFCNDDKLGDKLEKMSMTTEDPLWRMPLWQDYRKHIKSSVADIHNSAGLPGDLIYSALFLESFVDDETPWIHLDCFAWESSGRPGRPQGGCDTGLKSIVTFIEEHYC